MLYDVSVIGDCVQDIFILAKSKLIKETLTPHLYQKIIQNKEIEWQRYKKAVGKKFEKEVSPYEIKEYLPIL